MCIKQLIISYIFYINYYKLAKTWSSSVQERDYRTTGSKNRTGSIVTAQFPIKTTTKTYSASFTEIILSLTQVFQFPRKPDFKSLQSKTLKIHTLKAAVHCE